MRYWITAAIVFVALLAEYVATADFMPDSYKERTAYRRYCVRKDTETIEGKVITYWHRNGKPDWIMPAVETNVRRKVTGTVQNNPLQNELTAIRPYAAESKEVRKNAKKMGKNLAKFRSKVEKERYKAETEEERAVYNAVLTMLDGRE